MQTEKWVTDEEWREFWVRTYLEKDAFIIETGCCGEDKPLLSAVDTQPSTLDFVYAGLACWWGGKCLYMENSFIAS